MAVLIIHFYWKTIEHLNIRTKNSEVKHTSILHLRNFFIRYSNVQMFVIQFIEVPLSAILLLGLGLTGLHAQEAILATGANALGSGGSASYSIGQLVYTTNTGTTGSVAQGVQQPFEISVVSGIEEAKDITIQCLAYPNPATDFVKLKVENYQSGNLTYQLYDISGKLLENKKVEANEVSISMENLVPNIYFLKVFDNKKEVKTFKIIKN